MKNEVANLRRNYTLHHLSDFEYKENPYDQFDLWFQDALKSEILEANAMLLSTVFENKPKTRVVLLKGFSQAGFCFYTNYESNKGKEMALNNNVCLTFFWDKIERQVRIEGQVTKLPASSSDEYFNSRPRGSQIGAWVSEQSTVLKSRNELEERQSHFENKFKEDETVPRPPHWGGYIVEPTSFEFWQGRPSRLHDRLLYEKGQEAWTISRLSP